MLNDSLYDLIIQNYQDGKKTADIARLFNIAPVTVRKVKRYFDQACAGIPFSDEQRTRDNKLRSWAQFRAHCMAGKSETICLSPQKDPKKRGLDLEDEIFAKYDSIYDAVLSGASRSLITKQFNVSVKTVDTIAKVRRNVEQGIDFTVDKDNARITRWAKLRAENPAPAPRESTSLSGDEELTLKNCTKDELLGIVRKCIDLCGPSEKGPSAQAVVTIELLTIECKRLIDTLRKLKKEAEE